MQVFSMIELIRAKRDGKELTPEEIQFFVSSVVNSKVDDAQIGAFLMAAFLNGLSSEETYILTKSMTNSGTTFDWPIHWTGTVVDKHSTGGMGDKTSLVLAPALAACGLRVPMISGRGLDLTGGTLDKLVSIPGFSVNLHRKEMELLVESVGCCIVGQTDDIVPADKILYRIRDATATVNNENLIVASVISKKAAESLDALVLDIKVGDGAFMKDIKTGESLAHKLVDIGNSSGMKVSVYLTNMDSPLGQAVGNALEVAEAIETLQGKGPQDLVELVLILGGKLLQLTGRSRTLEEGKSLIDKTIHNGEALDRFKRMIMGQGTSCEVANEICHGDKWKYLPKADVRTNIIANSTGYIETLSAMNVGKVTHSLGCGRKMQGDRIKYHPGIILWKKQGEFVTAGDVIMEVHHDQGDTFAAQSLIDSVKITPNPPPLKPLLIKLIE